MIDVVILFRVAVNIVIADGMVSIGDNKSGNEASPTSRRRASNLAASSTAAVAQASTLGRVKRSPQGSVTGGSSTKGSERDEMEEVSNEEGQSQTYFSDFVRKCSWFDGVLG